MPTKKKKVAKPPVRTYKDVDGTVRTEGGGDAGYPQRKPEKHSPYKMYPGMHSEVNPGNFKGSEVQKYSAFNMHPMKYPQEFKDQKGTGPGVTQHDVIKARTEGYNAKMYKTGAHHPMGHKPLFLGKALKGIGGSILKGIGSSIVNKVGQGLMSKKQQRGGGIGNMFRSIKF